MDFATAVFLVLAEFVVPGRSHYSVEPCQSGGTYSTFHQTNVCKESFETGKERYKLVAKAMDHAWGRIGGEGWKKTELMAMTIAIGAAESGFREDVQNGRGANGKPDDVKGEGRGPSGETCFMQIHPTVLQAFADPPATPESLLGSDLESMSRCFKTGMRMIMHARRYCARTSPKTDWRWAVPALYATGNSCTTSNFRKTDIRYSYYKRVLPMLQKALKDIDAT